MGHGDSVRGLAAVVLGLLSAVLLWAFTSFGVGVACWFVFGKDEVPPAAEFAASLAPLLVAAGGGIVCSRMIMAALSNRMGGGGAPMGRGADYEQVAPAVCERCGGTEFERHGYIGLWDGGLGSGRIYEAVCLGCRAVWESRSDPIVCRDAPQSLRWFSYKHAEPFSWSPGEMKTTEA